MKLYYLEVYEARRVEKTHPMVSDSKKKIYQHLLQLFQNNLLRHVYPQLIGHLSDEQANFELNHQGTARITEISIQLLGDLLLVYCKDVMKKSSELTVEDVNLAFKKYSNLIGLDVRSEEQVIFLS